MTTCANCYRPLNDGTPTMTEEWDMGDHNELVTIHEDCGEATR